MARIYIPAVELAYLITENFEVQRWKKKIQKIICWQSLLVPLFNINIVNPYYIFSVFTSDANLSTHHSLCAVCYDLFYYSLSWYGNDDGVVGVFRIKASVSRMLYQRQNQYTLIDYATETFYTKLYINVLYINICICSWWLCVCELFVTSFQLFQTLS